MLDNNTSSKPTKTDSFYFKSYYILIRNSIYILSNFKYNDMSDGAKIEIGFYYGIKTSRNFTNELT